MAVLFFVFGGLLAAPSALTQQKLSGSNWVTEGNDLPALNLKFLAGGKLEIGSDDPEVMIKAGGRYQLSNNEVTISQLKSSDGEEPAAELRIKNCRLEAITNSLLHVERLVCAPAKLTAVNTSLRVPNGAARTIDKTSVVVHAASMQTTWALKVRTAPSTSSPALAWEAEAHNNNGREKRETLAKGEKVETLARTSTKTKVGKDTNYWYYIRIQGLHPHHPAFVSHYGWVFGEFLR